MVKVHYRDGYKGQLARTVVVPTPIFPEEKIETEFINLDIDGTLTIKSGYAWDFASGPTIDRPKQQVIGTSLVHDAFCQLHRNGYLSGIETPRKQADYYFYDLLKKNGMPWFRRKYWLMGVRYGAKKSIQKPKKIHIVPLEAP